MVQRWIQVVGFENLSISRANEIKINGTIPLCIGPQDCRSRAGRGGIGHPRSVDPISTIGADYAYQITTYPNWGFRPSYGPGTASASLNNRHVAGWKRMPTRPEAAATHRCPISEPCLVSRQTWGCPALSAWLISVLILKSIRSQETPFRSKGLFQRLLTKHCMYHSMVVSLWDVTESLYIEISRSNGPQ